MSRYTVAPLAKDDLNAIWNYIGIENDNPDSADETIEALFERFQLLARNPSLGRERPSLADLLPSLRSFPVNSYVIFYQPVGDGVRIGRVLHAARDARTAFLR